MKSQKLYFFKVSAHCTTFNPILRLLKGGGGACMSLSRNNPAYLKNSISKNKIISVANGFGYFFSKNSHISVIFEPNMTFCFVSIFVKIENTRHAIHIIWVFKHKFIAIMIRYIYYEWAKRTKFLLAVIYRSPRWHSNGSKRFKENRKKCE